MNKAMPKKAFILAAGKGTRLRPHTDTMPKPMVPVAGRSIIGRALEKLAGAGIEEVVVNLHHLAPVLEEHLSTVTAPRILLSHEDDLLETGGGIRRALHHFGQDPFYIINGDALWDEGPGGCVFTRLGGLWNEAAMDILLFLEPRELMAPGQFVGDYHLHADGRAERSTGRAGEYMFAGIRIAHPRIFQNAPDGAFSFLTLMDHAQSEGRLYGMAHDAAWYHISTPEDLADTDRIFRTRGER